MSALFITNSTDRHVPLLMDKFETGGLPYSKISLDLPDSYTVTTTFDTQMPPSLIVTVDGNELDLATVSTIWYRSSNPPDVSPSITDPGAREFAQRQLRAQLNGLWEILKVKRWVNYPDPNHKLRQLQLAPTLGFTIPHTICTSDPVAVKTFLDKYRKVIWKPVGGGLSTTSDGRKQFAFSSVVDHEILEHPEEIKAAPSIYQPFVQKTSELRITVIENVVFAVRIYSQDSKEGAVDWRKSPTSAMRHVWCDIPRDLERKCLTLAEALGLIHATIDLIENHDGQITFLEINSIVNWLWLEETTGVPITEAVFRSLSQT